MFEEVKHQIKAYLPDNLSPIATALIVGGVALFIGILLFALEKYFPGFVYILPESLFNIIVLSAATLLSGFIIWVFRIKKATKEVVIEPPSQPDHHYAFKVKEIRVDYKLIAKNKALYKDERTFIPLNNTNKPIVVYFEPLMKGVYIRLVKMSGYKTHNLSLQSAKQWRTSVVLETDFDGPLAQNSEQVSYVEFELRSKALPNHVYSGSRLPIEGEIKFTADLSYARKVYKNAKCYTFVSERATSPIESANHAPVMKFNNNILHWNITKPVSGHVYVLTWQEPCFCSWCASRNYS